MREPVFIVNCERISRRLAYYVRFPINDQLIQIIKELPDETRKWSALNMAWEITTPSLLLLIKKFRGSNKIRFDFGNEDSKKVFVSQIKKIELAEAEKRKFIAELNIKKENWVKFKDELEKNYVDYSDKLHALLNEEVKLYPHQIVASMFMNVTRSTLISHEMGLGKTLSAILFVEMNGFEKVVVITPNSLKFNFYNEVQKFTKSNSHIVNWRKNTCTLEDAKYIIVNYDYFNPSNKDRFNEKWKKLGVGKIDAVICDECFPYNTPILTNKGIFMIGDIIKYKLNVKVLSYNHKLKKIELKSIKRYLYRGYKDIIKINLLNGDVIECTPDHKFYSVDRDKYIPIKDFRYGEKIYKKKKIYSNKSNYMPTMWDRFQTKTKFTKILFSEMFNDLLFSGKCSKSINKSRKEWKYISNSNKNLSHLSNEISIKRTSWSEILFNKLFGKMENESTSNKETSLYKRKWFKNIKSNKRKLYKQTRIKNSSFRKNEKEQSHVQTGEYRKNERKTREIYFSFKRWKRSINKTTIKTFFGAFWNNRNENGTINTNINTVEKNESKCYISTNTLQGRYWDTEHKISNRSGWKNTSNKEMEILGQEKDRNFEIIGVESIEILESGDRRRFGDGGSQNKEVFDLEVKDNHNFFANGILVSNCQKLKNTKANTFKNFKRTFNKKIFKNEKISKIFLSGTPAPNRAHELYTVLNQISPTDFATKKYFQEYYCGMTYDYYGGWGYVTDTAEQKFEELFHKIAPFTHRKRKIEALKDLPDKTYQKVILEMDDNEYGVYEDIEVGVANEFVERPTSNPLTVMIRLRQYTAHLKIKPVAELIENILESGEKVVVVDFYKDSLNNLKEILGDIAGLHTGDQTIEERAEIVKQFQDPDSNTRVFLGSIQTCNYGLTLTAASKLFIITLPYSVGEYDQVSDRLHRIGQKNAVNIYALMFRETIDEYVFSAIEGKRKEIVKVMDNEDYTSNVSESVLGEVINKIKDKHGKTL